TEEAAERAADDEDRRGGAEPGLLVGAARLRIVEDRLPVGGGADGDAGDGDAARDRGDGPGEERVRARRSGSRRRRRRQRRRAVLLAAGARALLVEDGGGVLGGVARELLVFHALERRERARV